MDPAQVNPSFAVGESTPAPAATAAPTRDKIRVRFRKGGDLRFLSHHDLLRCFERLLRRAALPVRRTEGFHPHPRVVFALSLPLGVVGCEEVVEIELDDLLPVDELESRLKHHTPPGIDVLSVRRIDPKTTAQVRALSYRTVVPRERLDELRRRVAEFLSAAEVKVRRGQAAAGQTPLGAQHDEGTGRQVDVRPFVRDLRLTSVETVEGVRDALEIDLLLTSSGTARPVEVLARLGLLDLLEAGAVIERTRLELHDE